MRTLVFLTLFVATFYTWLGSAATSPRTPPGDDVVHPLGGGDADPNG